MSTQTITVKNEEKFKVELTEKQVEILEHALQEYLNTITHCYRNCADSRVRSLITNEETAAEVCRLILAEIKIMPLAA